jgi:neutral ceramidase
MTRTPLITKVAALAFLSGAALSGAPVLSGQAAQDVRLRVGAARIDITPPAPEGNKIRDRLYASAIVVDNGTTRAVLIGADQISFSEAAWADVTARLAADFKSPATHVLTTATHTHSDGRFGVAAPIGAPGRGGAPGAPTAAPSRGALPAAAPAPNAPRQSSALSDAAVAAVRRAVDRLTSARIGYGAGVSYFNVNRDAIHPETKRWYQGPNLSGESDKTLAILSFVAPDGKPIALFVNYAMHPISFYLRGIVSADFPGDASRYIESVYGEDVVVVWSQGAEGDQNPLYSRPGSVLSAARRGGGPADGMTIGTTAIGSVNAEIYTGIGTRIKARSPLAHTIVTALANGGAGSGYIPTEEAFNRYAFQVLGSRLKPGCAEDGIVTAALELLSEATR